MTLLYAQRATESLARQYGGTWIAIGRDKECVVWRHYEATQLLQPSDIILSVCASDMAGDLEEVL